MTDGTETFDAIVIGAGFGGLRMLHELREAGKSVQVFEAGSNVGGTWYWNRYPGARTDSEAWGYCYQFSKELSDDWTWSERLPKQPEVLRYLEHVADRFDLRRHIAFNARVTSASFDEARGEWTVSTDSGTTARAKYLVSATGVLSIPKKPDFPGAERFKGELYSAPLWPKEPVSYAGKRIAIVGSAATAIQILPVVAKSAEHVYYFQRTPNYVLPGRNYAIHEEEAHGLKRDAAEIFERRRHHGFGMPMNAANRAFDSVDDEERQRIFDAGWEDGGFHFCFETFDDIIVDQRSNDAASDFVRRKIRSIVKDPATAKALTPDYPIFAKRPPSGHFYYETFNRDNVTLVDVKNDPIREITETGIATGEQQIDVDMIILAIGFDAATGPLMSIDLRGKQGATIAQAWEHGPRTNLGLMVEGFPNMFMIMGPQAPFGNIPTIIEGEVEWIAKAIAKTEAAGAGTIEPTGEASDAWSATLQQMYDATLLSAGVEAGSWFLGANIPGKPVSVLFYFGGVSGFLDHIDDVLDQGLPGFEFAGATAGEAVESVSG